MKRLLDAALAAIGLLLAAPLLALAAIAIALEGRGPVLFRQERAGLGGRPFTILKLRTMTPGEAPDAERLTPLGRFLRRTSLDELPQLWNVLKGDMSLVGPRPLPTGYLPLYTPEQARRHAVRPGLTGWAQLHGRNATDWETRLALDAWYVEHRSLGLDLAIALRTLALLADRRAAEAPMPVFRGTGA